MAVEARGAVEAARRLAEPLPDDMKQRAGVDPLLPLRSYERITREIQAIADKCRDFPERL